MAVAGRVDGGQQELDAAFLPGGSSGRRVWSFVAMAAAFRPHAESVPMGRPTDARHTCPRYSDPRAQIVKPGPRPAGLLHSQRVPPTVRRNNLTRRGCLQLVAAASSFTAELTAAPSTPGDDVEEEDDATLLADGLQRVVATAVQLYLEENASSSAYVVEHARPPPAVSSSVAALVDAVIAAGALGIVQETRVALQLVRLAELVDEAEYVRPLEEWTPPPVPVDASRDDGVLAQAHLDSLLRHLLVRFDDAAPEHLLRAFDPFLCGTACAEDWAEAESPFASAHAWEMCRRFSRVLVEAGAGCSAVEVCRRELSPALTKGMVHAFTTAETPEGEAALAQGGCLGVESPLSMLRAAEVGAFGGSRRLWRSLASSILGKALGDPNEEAFAQRAINFMCTRESELQNVEVTDFANYVMATYRTHRAEGEVFDLKGRTVSSLLRSAGDIQERFTPSGMGPLVVEEPDGTVVEVREVLSAVELHNVGLTMGSCLQTNDGMRKYTAKGRARKSSFWAMTKRAAAAPGEPRYMLIFEVWNQSRIIYQAEGPHIGQAGGYYPTDEALDYMQWWAEENRVEWDTWLMW